MVAMDDDMRATVGKGSVVGLEGSGSSLSHFLEAKVVREVELTCSHTWD